MFYEMFILLGVVMNLIGGFIFTFSSISEYRKYKSVSPIRISFAGLGYSLAAFYYLWWLKVFS